MTDKCIARNSLDDVQSWQQGQYFDLPVYRNMTDAWKNERRREELKNVRPSPTGNSICQCAYPEDASWIAARLNLAAKLEQQIASPPASISDYRNTIMQRAFSEQDKAQKKFLQPNYVTLKVAEEAGEVVKAAVHYAEGRETWENLEKEVIQMIAMGLRLLTEGDQRNGITPPKSISFEVECDD